MKQITPWLLSVAIVASSVLAVENAEAKRKGKARKDIVVRGFISTISPNTVVVGGRTITLRATTKFEDFSGNRISLSAFMAGDCVKVKLAAGQTVATAREMELEDSCTRNSGDDDQTPTPTPSGTAAPTKTPRPSATKTPVAKVTPDSDDDDRNDDRNDDRDDKSSDDRNNDSNDDRDDDHDDDRDDGRGKGKSPGKSGGKRR